MISVWWLLPAGMIGAVVGALLVGIMELSSEEDDREERRMKREYGGIR